jgi:hypothetical protein
MSELSGCAVSAGWMEGLEVALGQALQGKPLKYGRLELTSAHLNRLNRMSTDCGGWIYIDDKDDETSCRSMIDAFNWARFEANASSGSRPGAAAGLRPLRDARTALRAVWSMLKCRAVIVDDPHTTR